MMIKLQNFTCAFLWCNDYMLMMKRAANRVINPNFWSGVGGKMECHEINDPYRSCLREINEETGLTCDDIEELQLKYNIMRRHEDVIRQSYVYFGNTKTQAVKPSDEGDLFWIPRNDVLDYTFTETYAVMMKHYFSSGHFTDNVITGIAENKQGELRMSWALL